MTGGADLTHDALDRHSRDGGNPFALKYQKVALDSASSVSMDSRLRGNDGYFSFTRLPCPATLGNCGAGTTIFWVDPELGMTFVAISTGEDRLVT
jgi:hypothetical protein